MAVARRRIGIEEGTAALAAWRESAGSPSDIPVPRAVTATAVRYTLEEVTARARGERVGPRHHIWLATRA